MDFALYQLKSLVSGSVIGGISLGGELVESQSTHFLWRFRRWRNGGEMTVNHIISHPGDTQKGT